MQSAAPQTIIPKQFPIPIKLSQSALLQHNQLKKLTQANELLMIKTKRCRESNSAHSATNIGKSAEIAELESRLERLRRENCGLEDQQQMAKLAIDGNYQSIQEKKMKIEELKKTNQRIQRQIAEMGSYLISARNEQKCLKQKIRKKQSVYVQSEKDINEYETDNAKIQSKIQQVKKQIYKIEDVLRCYKKSHE